MIVKTHSETDGVAEAAARVREIHQALVEFLRAGQSLAEVDGFVAEMLHKLGCRSAFFRYKIPEHPPFPSQSCLSLNDCVVHGTHTMNAGPLKPGDILSIDVGVVYKGWMGDAAWTYAIEHASDEALRLMKAGRETLAVGIDAMQPGRPLLDWARAVQQCAEDRWGYKLVRNLGGHGYGRKLHGPPFISNLVPRHRAEWPDAWRTFEPGLLVAVEPMLAMGTRETRSERREWPIFTADGSLAVHYEADVLICDDGPRDLTEGMQDLPDIVGI